MTSLAQALLDAHEADNRGLLVELYANAADAAKDETAMGFYLTQAFVYALELDHPNCAALRQRLVAMNREVPFSGH